MICLFAPFLAPRPALSQLTDLDIVVGPNKGAATQQNPAIFFLYDDKGMRFKITVDNLPAPNPFPTPGTQAWDDASQAKAQAIAFAINTQMPGERATVLQTVGFVPTKDGRKFGVVLQWEVHIENVTGIDLSRQDKMQRRSPFGETDQSRLTNRSTSKVSLPEGSLGGDGTTVATGLDPLGDSSVIQIGLLDPQLNIVGGDHLASVSPEAGMTEDDVLSALDLQLDAMGIPATFDVFSHELTLDNPVPEGDFLIWTTTDTGLNLSADFGVVVPVPGTLLLLGAGLAALAGFGRSRCC